MKKITLTLIMGILLSGCGLTDPWKDWADYGEEPADRMLPSDVRDVLCAADWWKFDYQDETFYFRFYDDGTVISNSTILRDELTTSYRFDWDDYYSVELTITDGGHLSYLSSGTESAFLITDYTESTITSTGVNTDEVFIMTVTTSEEVEAMAADKAEEVALIEATQRIIDAGFDVGAVYSGNSLVGHYYLQITSDDSEDYYVRFDILSDGVLTHETIAVSVDLNSYVSFTDNASVTMGGATISGMSFSNSAMTLTGASGLSVAANSSSGTWYSGEVSGYSTYKWTVNGTGNACTALVNEFNSQSYWSDIEFSDRDGRPLFYVPATWENNIGYVGLYSYATPSADSSQRDLVYLTGGISAEMPYGGDSSFMDEVIEDFPLLLDFYFNDNGVIIINDSGSLRLWLLSPSDGMWAMGEK